MEQAYGANTAGIDTALQIKTLEAQKMDEEPNAADRFGATLLFWGVVASFPVVFGTFVYFGIALAFAVF
jgi:hypothetical protein